MNCPRCHADNPAEMRFCGQCGASLTASVQPFERASFTGERRQLTVLFCDLVGSTELSTRMDPEDLSRLLRVYHDAAGAVIRALDGHVAQYLGDGLLVYFGYPTAHEDSAARAVRAARGILDALAAVNPRVRASFGVEIHARIGIHTGVVMVGEVGSEERQERLAVGETPNLAARVQGQSQPDTVFVTEATWRLVSAAFEGREIGSVALKGIAQPVVLYQVTGERGARAQPRSAGAASLVGREDLAASLRARWTDAKTSPAPVVVLSGEPGVGKSRVVQRLAEFVASDGAEVLTASCEARSEGAALSPLIDLLRRRIDVNAHPDPDAQLARLRDELEHVAGDRDDAVALLAALVSIPSDGRYTLAPRPPQKQRADTFDALLRWLDARAPALVVLEDLHWADPSTVELVQRFIERTPRESLMITATARPSFHAPWAASPRALTVVVDRLGRDDAARLVDDVAGGRAMPAELRERILDRAQGVPLYLEEVTRTVMESDRVRVTADRIELVGALPRDVIPATVQDSLLARLDRLGTARPLAQLAAVVGRDFDYGTLRDLGMFDEEGLRRELGALLDAGIIERDPTRDEAYAFRHVLLRDAAYESLLRSTRQRYHGAILRVLVDRDPDLAERRPELVAQHYAGAGLLGEAIEHWRIAGASSTARSAFRESESNYRRALTELDALPTSPERDRREVELRTGLGLSLVSTQGFATRDIEVNYARASELCARAKEVPFPVLIGVWTVVFVRGDREGVERVAGQMQRVAETTADPTLRLVAYSSLASRAFYRNEFREAQELGQRAIDTLEGRDPHAVAMSILAYGSEALLYGHFYRALADAVRGEEARARTAVTEAVALAAATGLPYMTAVAQAFGAGVTALLDAPAATLELSQRGIELATAHGLMFWVAVSQVQHGWARARLGEPAAGAAEVGGGLAMIRAIGANVVIPWYEARHAEALLLAGELDAGLDAVREGLTFAAQSLAAERTPPELLWLRGALLARKGDRAGAEASLREATTQATAQGATGARARAEAELARLVG